MFGRPFGPDGKFVLTEFDRKRSDEKDLIGVTLLVVGNLLSLRDRRLAFDYPFLAPLGICHALSEIALLFFAPLPRAAVLPILAQASLDVIEPMAFALGLSELLVVPNRLAHLLLPTLTACEAATRRGEPGADIVLRRLVVADRVVL